MIYDEEINSCILYTEMRCGLDVPQKLVSFYNSYPTCDGDLDITNDDILEFSNPYWLSDTFVFCKKKFNGITTTCYIKVNISNQVEEIGLDLEERFRCDYISLLKRADTKQATNLHKILFSVIGVECWLNLYRTKNK